MRSILRFYDGVDTVENNTASFDDIVYKWSDHRLQVRSNYFDYLFPSGKNLTSGLRYKFRTQPHLRKKVAQAVFRIMQMFGFSINSNFNIIQTKKIKREENWVVIGLYNPINYSRLTRIFNFLREIRMDHLSAILFLMMCKVVKEYPDLSFMIEESGEAKNWVKTQLYLKPSAYKALFSDLVIEEETDLKTDNIFTPEGSRSSDGDDGKEIKEVIDEVIIDEVIKDEVIKEVIKEPIKEVEKEPIKEHEKEPIKEHEKEPIKSIEIPLPRKEEKEDEDEKNKKLLEILEKDTKIRGILSTYPKEMVDSIPGTLEEKYNFILENEALEAKIEADLQKQREEMQKAEEIKKRIDSGELVFHNKELEKFKVNRSSYLEPFNKKKEKEKEMLEFEGFGGTGEKTVGGTKAWENMIKSLNPNPASNAQNSPPSTYSAQNAPYSAPSTDAW